jgi:LemA protein
MQMQANNAASSIDIQLTKRSETLVKLVDATKSSMKFEKSLLTDVTSMRGVRVDASNRNQVTQKMDSAFARLLATAENYPQIKSTDTVRQLMSSAEYIEREIASSREVYNSICTEFNK